MAGLVKNLTVDNKNPYLLSISEAVLDEFIDSSSRLTDYDSVMLVARVAMYFRNAKIPKIGINLISNFKWLNDRLSFDESVAFAILEIIIRFRIDDKEALQIIIKKLNQLADVSLKTKIQLNFASCLLEQPTDHRLKLTEEEVILCLSEKSFSSREKILAVWAAVSSKIIHETRLR